MRTVLQSLNSIDAFLPFTKVVHQTLFIFERIRRKVWDSGCSLGGGVYSIRLNRPRDKRQSLIEIGNPELP